MRSLSRILPFLVVSSMFTLAGCEKEDDAPDEHGHDDLFNTEVKVQVNFVQNGAPFVPGSMLLQDSLGVPMKVGRLRFFVSQPLFLDDVGDTVAAFPAKYLLMELTNNGGVQTIGTVSGHLHELHFGLGLDSATNHTDPTTFTQAPLNDPTMHWGWNPDNGYQFLQFEGFYESNGDGVVNAMDNGFLYHCGGDALLTYKSVEVHTDAVTGTTLVLVLECDVDLLMKGLSVVDDPVSEVVDATTQRLMTNLSNSLTYP